MPSILVSPVSGGLQVISAPNPYSGKLLPVGEIRLLWTTAISGANCYIALSGGMTVNSGSFGTSGGLMDGRAIPPGGSYNIPKLGITSTVGNTSGTFNIYASCDAAASGAGRLYYDLY